MSIVVDANQFQNFIDSRDNLEDHDNRPVFQWVRFGKGKLVYGGSKYRDEVRAVRDFANFLYQMEKIGKATAIKNEDVDMISERLENRYKRADFDDHHILSILIISECKLIFSKDKGLHSLIDTCFGKHSKQFIDHICPNRNLSKPRIYQNHEHLALLCDEYSVACKKAIKI